MYQTWEYRISWFIFTISVIYSITSYIVLKTLAKPFKYVHHSYSYSKSRWNQGAALWAETKAVRQTGWLITSLSLYTASACQVYSQCYCSKIWATNFSIALILSLHDSREPRSHTYLQYGRGELQTCMRFFTCKQVVHIHFPPLHIQKHDDAPLTTRRRGRRRERRRRRAPLFVIFGWTSRKVTKKKHDCVTRTAWTQAGDTFTPHGTSQPRGHWDLKDTRGPPLCVHQHVSFSR